MTALFRPLHAPTLLITSFVLFFIFLTVLSPFNPATIAAGLDPSWEAALATLYNEGARAGVDIVFTGGPLNQIYTQEFHPSNAYRIAILSTFYAIYIAIALGWLASARRSHIASLVFIIFFIIMIPSRDTFLMLAPVVMTLIGLDESTRHHRLNSIFGTAAGAISALAKFSIFPVLLLSCAILDITTLSRGRIPIHCALASLFSVVFFVISGQSIHDFIPYIQASLEATSGYSAAMSLTGSAVELAIWLISCAIFFCVMLYDALRDSRLPITERLRRIAIFLTISGFLFVSFKAGFVRHDLHSTIAWSALTLATLLYWIDNHSKNSFFNYHLIVPAISIAAICANYILFYNATNTIQNPIARIEQIPHQTSSATEFIISPSTWLKSITDRQMAAEARISATFTTPTVDGPVDTIQSIQSNIISSGQQYLPRPTIQEYTTYTPKLIARNRSFFVSERAPQYLYMAPGSIDGRHPASAEGSLWPLFLAKYEVVDSVSGMLLLRQRSVPLENILSAPEHAETRFNTAFALPSGDNPLFVSLDIRETLYGRLLNFFFKPPPVFLVVTYSDGSSGSYRLIPAMASEGMVLSPTITTSDDYLALARGDITFLRRPVSFTVVADRWGPRAYAREIGVSISSVDLVSLRNHYRPPEDDSALGKKEKKISALVSALTPNNPTLLAPSPEGVFAHAPASVSLPTTNATALALEFGIKDEAWQNGNATDGVCFSIRDSVSGDILFERCLDPLNNPADRHTQNARVAIPAGTAKVDVRTDCRQTCFWDWSYWSRVEPLPAGAP